MRAIFASVLVGLFLFPTGARAGIYCISDDAPLPFAIPPAQYLQVINDLLSCIDLPRMHLSARTRRPGENSLNTSRSSKTAIAPACSALAN